MAKNYDKLAKDILGLIGGPNNIAQFMHCATRLRFNVKDKSQIKKEEVEVLDGVFGSNWFGDQFQVIIGKEVEHVYRAICKAAGLNEAEAIKENLDETKKFSVVKVFETISSCLQPVAVALSIS